MAHALALDAPTGWTNRADVMVDPDVEPLGEVDQSTAQDDTDDNAGDQQALSNLLDKLADDTTGVEW